MLTCATCCPCMSWTSFLLRFFFFLTPPANTGSSPLNLSFPDMMYLASQILGRLLCSGRQPPETSPALQAKSANTEVSITRHSMSTSAGRKPLAHHKSSKLPVIDHSFLTEDVWTRWRFTITFLATQLRVGKQSRALKPDEWPNHGIHR